MSIDLEALVQVATSSNPGLGYHAPLIERGPVSLWEHPLYKSSYALKTLIDAGYHICLDRPYGTYQPIDTQDTGPYASVVRSHTDREGAFVVSELQRLAKKIDQYAPYEHGNLLSIYVGPCALDGATWCPSNDWPGLRATYIDTAGVSPAHLAVIVRGPSDLLIYEPYGAPSRQLCTRMAECDGFLTACAPEQDDGSISPDDRAELLWSQGHYQQPWGLAHTIRMEGSIPPDQRYRRAMEWIRRLHTLTVPAGPRDHRHRLQIETAGLSVSELMMLVHAAQERFA